MGNDSLNVLLLAKSMHFSRTSWMNTSNWTSATDSNEMVIIKIINDNRKIRYWKTGHFRQMVFDLKQSLFLFPHVLPDLVFSRFQYLFSKWQLVTDKVNYVVDHTWRAVMSVYLNAQLSLWILLTLICATTWLTFAID